MTDENRPPSVLKTVSLRKVYRSGSLDVPALQGVDLDIRRGEFVAVMGPSGCGKTTLLQILGGLSRPTSGRVFVDGVDLGAISDGERTRLRCQKIGFVFQRFNLLPTLTVQGNIEIARQIFGGSTLGRREIGDLLEIVQVRHKLDYKPTELSVGEQQRVAIARALVNEPSIILADEPTGNLDSRNSEQVLRLLADLNREKQQTIVMITHNPQAAEMGNRVIEMLDGQIVSHGTAPELVEAPGRASSRLR
ncbi:MAG TPA: ABC transporter ATP-binding protein [Vicinamibacteria bacterium]|nr:ABC transporter ATP-binding protein [Vicinamibacteria bacterium]